MRYYLDTEFNQMGGSLISLAVVSEEDPGFGLYLHTDCPNPKTWVREHVMPFIHSGAEPIRVGKNGFGKPLAQFLSGDAAPVLVCTWPDDIRHVCQIMKHWPDLIFDHPRFTFELVRVSGGHDQVLGAIPHNAWWDAIVLRHVVTSRLAVPEACDQENQPASSA